MHVHQARPRDSAIWRSYQQAFENYREKTRIVQSLANPSSSDGVSLDAAVLQLIQAREQYRISRDALLSEFVPFSAGRSRAGKRTGDEAIREIAGLLWEFQGKPNGTELSDWYRAEKIFATACVSTRSRSTAE